jgi:hypothetical protein
MFGITLFSQKMPALSLLSLTSVRENQRKEALTGTDPAKASMFGLSISYTH